MNTYHKTLRNITVMLISVSVLASTGPIRAFEVDKQIILHNEAMPLVSDMKVGRFGVGKLYFDDPMDVAVGEDNDVFILDSGNHRVQVMDEDGEFITSWGKRGKGGSNFEEPVAIAVDREGGYVYVLDKDNYLVQKFTLDGQYLAAFGEEGIRQGQFDGPVDITVDFFGYVYVLDNDRRKILKFHKSGAFVSEWGTDKPGRVKLKDPVSLTFSDELMGSILVLDSGIGSVVRFNREGRFEENIPLRPGVLDEDDAPVKIEAGSDGNLFILEESEGKLIKLKSATFHIFELEVDEHRLPGIRGLAVDDDDRIYISEIRKNSLIRFPLELD